MKSTIDRLIINSPYEEPAHYWSYDRETRFFTMKEGRRPAGYVIASESSKAFDDPGKFIEIPLVNKIRPRVKAWRESGYPGVTGITKRLLEHWRNPEEREHRRFFFCQLEAIETIIWLIEAPEAERVGIEIPSDGGLFKRLCSKMATGSGKTIVMAMLIAWQVLNKVTYPQDTRFSKYVFVVAPGLTVKSRLSVLFPSSAGNYYDEFNIVPPGLTEKLNQGKVLIKNWHALNWETEERLAKKKGVDKRGAKSNEAYVREVLGEMANAHGIIVIKFAFDHKKIRIDELCDSEKILHIDSEVLGMAESQEEAAAIEGNNNEEQQEDEPTHKLSKKEKAELLRQKVDTVGQSGKPGEQIQNVISVGMLSEGWDAKTVTHIMGLRAFSSQLLCEQVVGRGLRRTSYEINPDTGLFDAEYVNIFGVPFTFLPHESRDGPPPPPPAPKTKIEPVLEKKQFEINWPNIIRIDHAYMPTLTLDLSNVSTLELNAAETATLAELAYVVDGKPDFAGISEINLNDLATKFRMQRIIFETARDIYDQMKPTWKGNREFLLAQLIQLVEEFILSDKIVIFPQFFNQDDKKRRILITLNMNRVVHHIWKEIRFENTESITPVFNSDNPIRSTGDMRTWYTGKPCEPTKRSHINFCVFDSTWEASESLEFDRNPVVEAWVKNDHLGFEIIYIFKGEVRKYRPDFIIRLKNGKNLILETKGQDTQQDKTKREFLDEWVKAVNQHGGFGIWQWSVSKDPADVAEILEKASEV